MARPRQPADTLRIVPPRYRENWSELARREPYFAVLTEPRFLRSNLDADARREFFASGEADVAHLLTTISETLGGPFSPASALDFGCGVGRLSLPLAQRVARVVGVDIAPDMVAEAQRNAELLGVSNAEFVTRLDALGSHRFDFVCSLIVFQHIPAREGLETLTRLLQLLAPGGVAAIHFIVGRPGGVVRRFARRLRGAVPFLHRLALRIQGDPLILPYMQMNAYDAAEVERRIVESTGARPRIVPRADHGMQGALFVVRRA